MKNPFAQGITVGLRFRALEFGRFRSQMFYPFRSGVVPHAYEASTGLGRRFAKMGFYGENCGVIFMCPWKPPCSAAIFYEKCKNKNKNRWV